MNNLTPVVEIHSRWQRTRELVARHLPEADGVLVFSRLNIFYFTGTLANGVFWLPMSGEPILFCRRGIERAEVESKVKHIIRFNTYRDIAEILIESVDPRPEKMAAEMNGLSWSLANSLVKHFAGVSFIPADRLIAVTRAIKSEWELNHLREAGAKIDRCLTGLLVPYLHEGITELEIARRISDIIFSEGHNGVMRMETFGEEDYQGHIAIGDSANYPGFFNGPVSMRGVNPAAPFMRTAEVTWQPGSPLIIDHGFTIAGYQTDKSQVYWLGSRETIPGTVQSAQDFCVEMQVMVAERLKPGAIPEDLWNKCLEIAAQSAWQEGFMGLGSNKVNFIGHGVGLVIDEYPVLANGFDQPLQEGMVLAVEPKIGIPGVGMVGTENTFEVTRYGGKSLTGNNYEIITV